MDQQPANNHQVLTKDTIQNALVHSAIPGVSALVPEQKFYVRADQKDDCLTLISELCSARWVQKNKRFGSSVIYNELLYCHRAGQYIPRREVRLAQKDSKKCGCQGCPYLGLTTEVVQSIKRQLSEGRNCRDIRMTILRQLDSVVGDSNTGQRRVHYEDVYNIMNKLKKDLYEFNQNDMLSVQIWLEEKLPQDNYII
ncbi:hypothetical protein BDA99DRAFT_446284, partial [Phascolomyces articulosus]